MARAKPIQNSFNGGEFSPRMYGRTDIQKYGAGAQAIENWHIMPEGGLERRSGFRYASDAASGSTRLKEFIFSDGQAYVMEFSNQSIRFFRNEGLLVHQTLSGIQASTEVSSNTSEFTVVGPGYNDEDGPLHITTDTTLPPPLAVSTDYYVRLPESHSLPSASAVTPGSELFTVGAGHGYFDQMGPFRLTTTGSLPNGLDFEQDYYIVFQSATTFKLSTMPGGSVAAFSNNGTGTHTIEPTGAYKRDKFRVAATPTGAAVDITAPGSGLHTLTPTTSPRPAVTLSTPYQTADIPDLQFAQSADVLYIAHPSHAPRKLSRVSAQGFFLEEIDFRDGPYLTENTTADTIEPSATTGNGITLTCTKAIFKGSDVGRLVRIYDSASGPHWGYAKIVGVNPLEFQDADIEAHDFAPLDVTVGNDQIAITSHGIDTGEAVRVKEVGTIPGGIVAATLYYARAVTVNIITLHPTRSDAIANTNRLDILTQGSGAVCARLVSSVIDVAAHGYSGGEGPVQLSNSGGALPEGLAAGTDYYVVAVDSNSFALSLTRGGETVGITDNQGGGTHSVQGASAPSPTCTANVKSDFRAATASAAWRLGAWSSDADIGYPRSVSFHEQRLWFAGNAGAPQTIYASRTADFETHSPTGTLTTDETDLDSTVSDSNGIVATIGSNEINVLRWLSPSRTLLAGTSKRIWNLQPASDASGFSPTNTEAQPGGTRGASSVQPVVVDNRPVFCSNTGLKIGTAGYSIDSDSYVGQDLTLVAEHVLRPGAVQLAYAADPWSTVFAVRTDGELAALTLIADQEVAGWGRFVLGGAYVASYSRSFTTTDVSTVADTITDTAHGIATGSQVRFKTTGSMPAPLEEHKDYWVRAVDADTLAVFENAKDANDDRSRIDLTTVGAGTIEFGIATNAKVLSAAVIPAPTGDPNAVGRNNIDHDQLWVIAQRTINGATKTTVEYLEDVFEPTDAPENGFFVDSGATYNGVAATSITGLTHLAGELVDALADGKVIQAARVSDAGVLTLDDAASKVHVGLRYPSAFVSLRQALPSQEGSSEMTLGRIEHLVLRLDSSLGGEFGHSLDHMTDLSDLLLPHDHLFDTVPPLYSDDIEVALDAPWETSNRFAVRQTQPLPFTLLAVSTPMQKGRRGNRSR